MDKRTIPFVLFSLAMVSMILAGCAAPATSAPQPTEVVAPTEAPPPAPSPTPIPPAPLGTADNPIIMGFVPSGTSQEFLTGGDAIAKQISTITGYSMKTFQATSYSALVEAMGSGNAQIGWLASFAYVVAKQKGYADVGLVTIRNGSDHYAFQIIAHADDKYTPGTDAATTLAQFKGKRPCWVDQLSGSGYVLPLGFFKKYNIALASPAAFVGGHPAVVRAVYAKGICDFGATFIDARTSSAIQKDLPDVMDKMAVIYKSDPFIPNDTVSFATDLPQDQRQKIVAALLQIAGTEEGKKALQTVYQIDGLKAADDTFFDVFRVYLQAQV